MAPGRLLRNLRRANEDAYVALGDSISIDTYAGGRGRGGASLLASNRDEDFPDWRGRDLAHERPDLGFELLATDGATSDTVLARQPPRLDRLGVTPRVATLTAGGNDLLAAYGDSAAAREVIHSVTANVRTALSMLRGLLPTDGVIVVGTVYDPSDGTADAARLALPAWPDAVEVLAELNAGLASAALDHDAVVADIHGLFLGHGVLAGHPAQSSARPASRDLWYCNIIEPNAWGASGVRAAFWEALHRTK